jgi:hypothetical protein
MEIPHGINEFPCGINVSTRGNTETLVFLSIRACGSVSLAVLQNGSPDGFARLVGVTSTVTLVALQPLGWD